MTLGIGTGALVAGLFGMNVCPSLLIFNHSLIARFSFLASWSRTHMLFTSCLLSRQVWRLELHGPVYGGGYLRSLACLVTNNYYPDLQK